MKYKKRVIFILISILLLFGIGYYTKIWENKGDEILKTYSVILYQNTDNEWVTLLEGIHQAEDDLKVKINEVTIKKDGTFEDQKEAIEKEIEAGSAGILIAAVDSKKMEEYMQSKKISIPIVFIESGAGNTYPDITADNYEMGSLLGKQILEDMEKDQAEKTITIVQEYLERDSVQERYDGLMDVLKKEGEDIEIHSISRRKGDFSLRLLIGTSLNTKTHYLVALDKFCTEEAGAAGEAQQSLYKSENSFLRIYGIGNTPQNINALDNEKIDVLVFQNEFSIGYEGLRELIKNKNVSENTPDIMYKVVTKKTLYDTENERLLFTSD